MKATSNNDSCCEVSFQPPTVQVEIPNTIVEQQSTMFNQVVVEEEVKDQYDEGEELYKEGTKHDDTVSANTCTEELIDYLKAIECYLKSADQINPNAQFFIGQYYFNGKGVEKDYSKALEWYLKS